MNHKGKAEAAQARRDAHKDFNQRLHNDSPNFRRSHAPDLFPDDFLIGMNAREPGGDERNFNAKSK
jgi:hypothetical protein